MNANGKITPPRETSFRRSMPCEIAVIRLSTMSNNVWRNQDGLE